MSKDQVEILKVTCTWLTLSVARLPLSKRLPDCVLKLDQSSSRKILQIILIYAERS